ncbi:MAG TPA: putative peptidoglycan glycosyltransferase FtsW [Acidimicrobiales bacterium]|nr:putative peptidoglycan glycosyltransferase FtsW [Acidimicrobiales bacterium]
MARSTPRRARLGPFPRGDATARTLLIVTALLVTFGTVAVASASEGQSAANGAASWSIAIRDLVYLGLGLAALYVAARVRAENLVRRAPVWIVGGLGLLFAVKAVGVSANGGKRWINLHAIYLQPSELFKFAVVLFIAWLVEHHHDQLGDWRRLALWTAPVTLGAVLIVVEPDIGTSSVVVAIALVMLAVAGLSRALLVRIVAVGALAFGGYMMYRPYSASRFFSFLHPNQNLMGTGYQLLQSKIGLGAGGLTGLGLGHSREKWGLLPNPHTDFIFTIVGEEMGFIGTMVVLVLFVAFLLCATRVAQRCAHQSLRLVAVGITTWICLEAAINVASVVGGWAVTGIPLPFFSYGGTALITELAAVGLLYNIAHVNSRTPDLEVVVARRSPVARRPERSVRHAQPRVESAPRRR